jgi:DNA repair protein RecO (recombination protein O)
VSLYRDDAVVLRTYKLGEADRIVVLLARDHGKVRAVAKGVRKTKSKFGARLEPISHIEVQLYTGRGELDIVTQAESVDSFRLVREDLDRLRHAVTMLEAVDQIAQDGEPAPRIYQMLLGALRTLETESPQLVLAGFFWKLLALEGFAPMLDECAMCGATEPLVAFDLDHGGVLCVSCRRGQPISAEALELLRMVLGGRLVEALDEPPGPAATELENLATRSMEHVLERRLRSASVLEN